MDLNAFPDPVLRAVFDRVPLLDLGRHIPLVCHRWHSLQPSVLSGKVKALAIVIGRVEPCVIGESTVFGILHEDQLTNEDGSRMFPSSMDDPKVALTLTFPTLTWNRVDSLIGALRNVDYLQISARKGPPVGNSETIPLIDRLLDHWAHSLKTLKLDCSLTGRYEQSEEFHVTVAAQLDRLIVTVNTLPLLEHLTLDLHEDLRKATFPLDLPILGRLKEFNFSYASGFPYSNADLHFRSLKRYAEPNRQLRSVGLGTWGSADQYLSEFAQSPLAQRFSMLSHVGLDIFGLHPINVEERGRFLNTFSNITFYTLKMTDLTIVNLERVTTTLAPLTRLVHLYLVGVEPFSNFDTEPVDAIRPLPSVNVLTLHSTTGNHSELASKHWTRMFPNLQIIMLFNETEGCTICGFENGADEPEMVAHCVRQTLLPFKQQFPRTLKKVYYCRDYDYDNLKVFTLDTI